jgi:phosphate transport system protein
MNRQFFQDQLDRLMADTLALGSRVESVLSEALHALKINDLDLMQRIVADDKQINAAAQALHERCLTLIARQQPMASDLREISVVLSLLPELERMADHAATCCKIGRRMNAEPGFVPLHAMVGIFPEAIPEMGERVLRLLHNGLDALARRDAAYAEQLCQDDDPIDHIYRTLFRATIDLARSQPEYSDEAIHLLSLAHNLERIGDRVTNLAEQVVFLLRGEIVELNT